MRNYRKQCAIHLFHQLLVDAYSVAISSFIFAIASAGLRCFGHVRVPERRSKVRRRHHDGQSDAQLKIVWQRYKLSVFCMFALRAAFAVSCCDTKTNQHHVFMRVI